MAKKKDGITDLTKTLVSAAQKFNDTEYNRLQHLIFALLHGVNFGYTSMDQRFLDDSSDIYFLHKDKELSKQLIKTKKIKYKDNVIQLDKEYGRLQHLIFALLHGVNYGYTSMDQQFLDDSSDIYFLHKDQQDNLKKVIKKNKTKYTNNVIQLKDFSREVLNGDG
jgi:hypothetical protein